MLGPIPLQTATEVVRTAFAEFVSGVAGALPDLLTGVIFLVLAAIFVKVVMTVVRFVLQRSVPESQAVYRQFVATVVLVFLVFGVVLSFLSIVGLPALAASLGTATGFLALGVSYALSGMLADAVAGVYLLRDPDFMPGDRVDVGGTVGEVKTIELRKTRISVEEGTVVRGNSEIEKKWTKLGEADDVTATPEEAAEAEASVDATSDADGGASEGDASATGGEDGSDDGNPIGE